jgi:hypothetical protein
MFLTEDDQKAVETPTEGLLAPYTTNPPSPAKSQKSSKSENTPQSVRGILTNDFKVYVEGTPGSSRGVPPACNDLMTSRHLRKSPEDLDAASSKEASNTMSQSSPVICRQPPGPVEDMMLTEPSPPNDELETPVLVQTTIKETFEEKYDTPSSIKHSIQAQVEHVTASSMEISYPRDSPVPSEVVTILPPVATSDAPTFDGSVAALDIRKLPISFLAAEAELLHSKSSPSLLDTASFVHPDSPFRETFTPPNPISPAESPPLPGRSNSVLYAQIRSLQRQLTSKTEEVRQLKKQLDARGSLDIVTFSEQLREATREIQVWKTRAEVAEKQVEMFTKLPSREISRQRSKDLSLKSSQILTRANTGYAGEAAEMAARIRNALHGMDGNNSPAQWNSEESSYTVIREGCEGSEHGS